MSKSQNNLKKSTQHSQPLHRMPQQYIRRKISPNAVYHHMKMSRLVFRLLTQSSPKYIVCHVETQRCCGLPSPSILPDLRNAHPSRPIRRGVFTYEICVRPNYSAPFWAHTRHIFPPPKTGEFYVQTKAEANTKQRTARGLIIHRCRHVCSSVSVR